jgi:methionyl aminopeptidase
MRERGAGLLELLLSLAVFMAILPFAYRFATDRRDQALDMAAARRIAATQSALEQYIAENKQSLLAPLSAQITRIKLSDLKTLPPEMKDSGAQIRIVKSKDSAGRSFVQGMVIYPGGGLSPLRTRRIALAAGQGAGFAEGAMLHGSYGTWRTPLSAIGANATGNDILAQTRPMRSGGDYLQRLPSNSPLDATMQSNLDMGGHDIMDAKSITASSVQLHDVLTADTIETSKMTVANRLDWTAGLEIFGDAMANGPITSDGRAVDAGQISVAGRSQFRSVTAQDLRADNLYLAGFSVGGTGKAPILSIAGTLDMTGGHLTAMEATVGFSGSVTPKLVVSNRIEDAANPAYFWDLSGLASLGDMMLSNLNQTIKTAFARERTGKTETERIMGQTIQNSNATAADFLRANGARSSDLGYHGFPKHLCTSVNDVIVHGIPREDEILRDGDIINVDITAEYKGFHGDASRMFMIGNVRPRAREMVNACLDALNSAIAVCAPGVALSEIGRTIEEVVKPHGFSISQDFIGHGIGKVMHDDPQIYHWYDKKFDNVKMVPGLVFTIEPIICEKASTCKIDADGWTARTNDGGWSAQWEHTIGITEDGAVIFTERIDGEQEY